MNNITDAIKQKLGRNLYQQKNHPLEIVKRKIYEVFEGFEKIEGLEPKVPAAHCFDMLLVPKDHPARAITDTYYEDEETVLRTQMTAHLVPLVKSGHTKYLVTGDVYRKDTVDATHAPVFHQIDGFCLADKDPAQELRHWMSKMVETLFPGQQYRFKDNKEFDDSIKAELSAEEYEKEKFDPETEFPFTYDSTEIEVLFNMGGEDKWVEVLGGGTVEPDIMSSIGLGGKQAWAFGLGLERLAMILFNIKDIRYFWTEDERFLKQFASGQVVEFKEYSKYPPVNRDISFWTPEGFHENEFMEISRAEGDDLIESISLSDKFTNPKTNRTSLCYSLVYRSPNRTLTDDEINEIHNRIENSITDNLGVEVR